MVWNLLPWILFSLHFFTCVHSSCSLAWIPPFSMFTLPCSLKTRIVSLSLFQCVKAPCLEHSELLINVFVINFESEIINGYLGIHLNLVSNEKTVYYIPEFILKTQRQLISLGSYFVIEWFWAALHVFSCSIYNFCQGQALLTVMIQNIKPP